MDVVHPTDESPADQLRRLYRFMASREFVASREELTAAGFSRARIDNWLRSGRLIKIVRSVYSYGRDVETVAAVRRAALLAAGPGSALVGRSACEAWGIVRANPGLPVEMQVGSPVGQARSYAGISPALSGTTVKVVRRELRPQDVRNRNALPIARAPLALVGLAVNATQREVMFAFLEACRLRHFTRPDLSYCFESLFHKRGIAKLRPCLVLWVPELERIRSVLEGWFLLVWIERGYPMPLVNEKVGGYEVDFFWPFQRYVLELDGDAFHGDPVRKRIDREKQLALEGQGLRVDRVTFRQFAADPVAKVDEVARRLGYR
jgi:hypothetical protein